MQIVGVRKESRLNTASLQIQSYVVVPDHYRSQVELHSRLKQKAKKFEAKLEKQRAAWELLPPENMIIRIRTNGVVLSLPQEAGRILLHKRMCSIIEHDVSVDAVLDGELEDVLEAMEA